MSLILYAHPFSSYCWKVLIALWEGEIAFDYRRLDNPAVSAEWARAWPLKKMPLLIDDGEVVPEASVIIERLQLRFPDAPPMIPRDPEAALRVRMLDRLSDNYLMGAVQAIVAERLRGRPDDDAAATQARATLAAAYEWWDGHMSGREWAADAFGLADCAAGPALFYADWVQPIPERFGALRAYRARLLARPSLARAVDEARPFRSMFPLGDPGRD